MSYNQITYGDSTYTFKLIFPDKWIAADVVTVKLQLADEAGTELLAAESATRFTATTLNGAVSSGTLVATLTAAALEPGDVIEIADSDAGPPERRTVDYYNATTKVVYVTEEWSHNHTTAAAVAGCWVTDEVDISDGDDFDEGAIVVATWSAYDGAGTPTLVYTPITEMYQVGISEAALAGFWLQFEALYPIEYEVVKQRDVASYRNMMNQGFKDRLWTIDKQADRVVNQRKLDEGLRLYTRLQIVSSQGDETKHEYDIALAAWNMWFNEARDSVLWQDKDQDGAIDDGEAVPSVPVFDIGYFG